MMMKKSSSDKVILSQKHATSEEDFKGKVTEGHSIMKRSISDKILLMSPSPKSKQDDSRGSRFLVAVNVFGSPGPLRFIVSGDDIAATVIETALKRYAREGRLPVLGTDIKPFFLYTVDNGFSALKSSEAIGSCGSRNFVLWKQMTESKTHTVDRKAAGSGWRACFQKVSI